MIIFQSPLETPLVGQSMLGECGSGISQGARLSQSERAHVGWIQKENEGSDVRERTGFRTSSSISWKV